MAWIALTREVSESITGCELTHLARRPIDVGRARTQHAAYETALRELGCRVERVPAAHDCPDSVFVEDTAVVLPELAIVARPGAPSRRAETEAVRTTLQTYREVAIIEPPGTLDGGDVLAVGRTLFIGRTPRTNAEGIEQMRRLVSPMGYSVVAVSVEGCLHLKSAVTAVSDEVLLVQPLWVDRGAFPGHTLIEVDPRELHAANALRIGDRVIYPSAFPRTAKRIAARGIDIYAVDASELAKAEGAVTCCSLVFCERAGS